MLRKGENNNDAHSSSTLSTQANQLEPKSWGAWHSAASSKTAIKSQGHVLVPTTASPAFRVPHAADKNASNLDPLLSSWRPASRPASAIPSERPSVKVLARPWSASAGFGSSKPRGSSRPLSASGFRDVDTIARDLVRKHTTEIPRTQPPSSWMHGDTQVDAGTSSLDVLLEKSSREYFNSDEDEDLADECLQLPAGLLRNNPDLAVRVKKNMVASADEQEHGHRGSSNKTAKVCDSKVANIGDVTNFKSVAVLFEAKLLEVAKLPQRGDGGPSELKTAACCQLLEQLSQHIGYHGPLLWRLAREIFASIYQDYNARRPACDNDKGDSPMPFDLVPYYAVVRSMQDELSLLRTEKRTLKNRCPVLTHVCMRIHMATHSRELREWEAHLYIYSPIVTWTHTNRHMTMLQCKLQTLNVLSNIQRSIQQFKTHIHASCEKPHARHFHFHPLIVH
jgi:hypothetical protein